MSNEYYDNIHIYKVSENCIISSDSNNLNYKTSSLILFFKELLQELNVYLLNMGINEYDIDPKNLLEIMTCNSQNIFCYSSLIGYFYQHGIGCEANEIKAFEVFSNAIKSNQKIESNQFSFIQENDTIIFCKDIIKKLNEIILQYFYSLFLYEDIILYRKDNYKLHIKNAEKGNPTSQYYISNCYYYGKDIRKDSFEWYLKSSEGENIKEMKNYKHNSENDVISGCPLIDNLYDYEYSIRKNEKKVIAHYLKSAEGGDKYASCILKDKSKAFEWHLKAAEKEKEFYWNRKATINGISNAQYKIADYYLDNFLKSKAFKWYLELANKSNNNLKAVYLVAKYYRDEIGTDKNSIQNLASNGPVIELDLDTDINNLHKSGRNNKKCNKVLTKIDLNKITDQLILIPNAKLLGQNWI
ncbi:hypothetical protein C1645_836294 [Glomus cerebriforme]|uniref:Sel1 repeat protein n=1 Tax=Glomus cerebriforme TaxID=658196 RepID=A0A397SAU7_9GLOM|nr:hypothetical protein C1645_836294 [Glomus cerebriforme]